jgi:uncharacterized repeat protein (TIGR02543 family)
LEIDRDVEIGAMPSYDGTTPSREADAQYSYSFSGWSPSLTAVTGNATYVAQYIFSTQSYTVTWKDDDGTILETDTNIPYGAMPSFDGTEPSKASTERIQYSFNGWAPTTSTVVGDAVYTATYREEKITYAVSWYDDDYNLLATENYEYGEMPSYKGAEPTKENTSRYIYTFSGWYPEIVPVAHSTSYNAQFDSTKQTYTLTLNCDPNKGSVTGGGVYEYNEFVTIYAEPNEGYIFADWYSDGEILGMGFSTTYIYMPDHDYTAEATFGLEDYDISYVLGGGTNNQTNPSEYTIESDTITLQNPTRINYVFDGWHDENNNLVTKIEKGSTGDIILTAYWIGEEHNVFLSCDETKGSVSGAGTYHYGSSVTIVATPKANYGFSHWTNGAGTEYVSFDPSYTFSMSGYDVTYVAVFNNQAVKGDKFAYGVYPQTEVTNTTVTNQLRTLAGALPSASNNGQWTDYNYYISGKVEHFMWYQDVQYEGSKYRGVYFTQYRPFAIDKESSSQNSAQGLYFYYPNNVYWFKFEPIQWTILDVGETMYTLFSDISLDAQQYYSSLDERVVGERTIYASNYEYSDLRGFVNNDFLNLAFTSEDQEKIQTMNVWNDLSSQACTENIYVQDEYTVDKLFVPSRNFAITTSYFADNTARKLGATDYAKCQGWYSASPYFYGNWWTRSPSANDGTHSFFIKPDGTTTYAMLTNYTCLGVTVAFKYIYKAE